MAPDGNSMSALIWYFQWQIDQIDEHIKWLDTISTYKYKFDILATIYIVFS